jgi:hypothetical protein
VGGPCLAFGPGLARAKAQSIKLGRPKVTGTVEERIRELRVDRELRAAA